MVGDQDTPIINLAFDVENPKKNAVQQFVADYSTIQPKQAKTNTVKVKTETITPNVSNDYAQEAKDVLVPDDNSKDVPFKKAKNSIVRRNSTETSKQDQNSEMFRDVNEKTNKMTESYLSGKSRNVTRTQVQRPSEATKNVN